MLAINPKTLHLEQYPCPNLGSEELLISVKAIGVNHADLLQRRGNYPPPLGSSPILGLEVCGVVKQIDPHVKRFKKDDLVMCLLQGGGYAEKVVVHESRCMLLPKNLSFVYGAAIPEVFLTAYQALFTIGQLQPGQWVLIHTGGSGVGTAAIQLSRAIDAKPLVTTRSQEKLEKCLAIGASAAINPTTSGFAKKVLELTEGQGSDLILDFVGASYFKENMEAIAPGGAMICLATLGGAQVENFDLRQLLKKWVTFSGTTLRSRPQDYVAKLIEEFSDFALPRFETGSLRPIIDTVFPWGKAKEAHKKLLQNQAFGKIVLIVE